MSKKKQAVEEPPKPVTGSGVFVWNEQCRYEGDWMEVKRTINAETNEESLVKVKHGKGTYLEHGVRYEGSFDNDAMHGDGTLTFRSGATYVGRFAHNKFDGRGKYVWPDGVRYYDGEWREGRMHGRGAFCGADGLLVEGSLYNGSGMGLEKLLDQ